MMFPSIRWFRPRRLGLLFVFFVAVSVILFKELQREYDNHPTSEKNPFLSEDKITTIQYPSMQVWVVVQVTTDYCLHLASTFPNWFILQYGDIQLPHPSARHKHCHYLTKQQLPTVSSQVADAFLYAMQNGAEAIYIHPSPQSVKDITYPKKLVLQPSVDGLTLASGSGLFNPLQHWGCNYTDFSLHHHNHHSYAICKNLMISIQAEAAHVDVQSEAGAEMDVDVYESCDTHSPNVVMDGGTYAHFSSVKAFYMSDAFWALPIMEISNLSERVCFSFLLQQLMWLTGQHLLIYSGKSLHVSRNVNKDHIQKCRNFLVSVTCESSDFLICVRKLSESFPEWILNRQTINFFKNWTETIHLKGYRLPMIHKPQHCNLQNILYTPVNYKVPYRVKKWRSFPFQPINNINAITLTYENTCKLNKHEVVLEPDFLAPWTTWDDVLLIIVFNNPHYEVVPYLEVLYRSFFPHILYCGPTMPNSAAFHLFQTYNLSFVAYGATPEEHTAGSFNYKCFMIAVQMKYNVHGYLIIADDLLLIPQRLKSLSLEKAWFMPKTEIRTADIKTGRECRLGMCDFHTAWRWWEDYKNATIKALHHLESRQNESGLIRTCVNTLVYLNHGHFHVNGGYSDVYYIPQYLANSFVPLFTIFLRHYVFLEIAVPTVFRCLVEETEMEALQGKQIWDESRGAPWKYFTKHDLAYKAYLHPTKWSHLAKNSYEHSQFFCTAVSYMHDPYKRLNKIHI